MRTAIVICAMMLMSGPALLAPTATSAAYCDREIYQQSSSGDSPSCTQFSGIGPYAITYICDETATLNGNTWVDVPIKIGGSWELVPCQFEPGGNRICAVTEEVLGRDHDNDGIPNCEDDDDDGDRLTDRYESRATFRTNPINSNTDEDSDETCDREPLLDTFDWLPLVGNECNLYSLRFTVPQVYYHSNGHDGTNVCDGGGESNYPPEIYLKGAPKFSILGKADHSLAWGVWDLALPTTWRDTTGQPLNNRPEGNQSDFTFEPTDMGPVPAKWLAVPNGATEVSTDVWAANNKGLMVTMDIAEIWDEDVLSDNRMGMTTSGRADLFTTSDTAYLSFLKDDEKYDCTASLSFNVKWNQINGTQLNHMRNAVNLLMDPSLVV